MEGKSAYRPGLERVRKLLEHAGNPHLRFPAIHVAGTNGKGSTASLIAAILTASGLRVGLHTSPHIHDLSERMRIDGVPAPADWINRAVAAEKTSIEATGASFFEAVVLLSFLYFADCSVDVSVVEVGMGGRYDATNVLTPEVSVITDIGLDHTEVLGSTVEQIAREKAGIIKAGSRAVTVAEDEVLGVLREVARATRASIESVSETCRVTDLEVEFTESRFRLETPRRTYGNLVLRLPGRHQLRNAPLAVRAVELLADGLALDVSGRAVRSGLADVQQLSGLVGRFHILSDDPLIVTDNAHNAGSLGAALGHLAEFCTGTIYVGLGLMREKDAEGAAGLLSAHGVRPFVIPLTGGRAFDVQALRAVLKQYGLQVDIRESASEVVGFFREAGGAHDVLLLTGSHQVVAQALAERREAE